jgi:catalase
MHEFGRLVLNKNPENYHRDVEQAAFSPGSMVPGIEDSPDPLLQFRMFFYRDAQYHRIGVNLHQIPVNCPFMAGNYSSLNFDGPMRVDADHAGNKQYAPNSFSNKFRPDTAEAPYAVSDNIVSRKSHYAHEGKQTEYTQATELYKRLMSNEAREHTHQNTAKMLRHVKEPIIQVIRSEPLLILIQATNSQFRRSTWHRSTTSLQSTLKPYTIFCPKSISSFPKWRRCQRTLTNFTKSPNSLQVRMIA